MEITDVIEHPPTFTPSLGISLALWEHTLPEQLISSRASGGGGGGGRKGRGGGGEGREEEGKGGEEEGKGKTLGAVGLY